MNKCARYTIYLSIVQTKVNEWRTKILFFITIQFSFIIWKVQNSVGMRQREKERERGGGRITRTQTDRWLLYWPITCKPHWFYIQSLKSSLLFREVLKRKRLPFPHRCPARLDCSSNCNSWLSRLTVCFVCGWLRSYNFIKPKHPFWLSNHVIYFRCSRVYTGATCSRNPRLMGLWKVNMKHISIYTCLLRSIN